MRFSTVYYVSLAVVTALSLSASVESTDAVEEKASPFDTLHRALRPGPPPPPETTTDDPMTTTSKPGTQGDPHFKTHGGEMYDFHGGCDLVLLDNPGFMDGRGLLIHVRTKIETWWSYVESSVVRIGADTIEINGSSDVDWLFINGEPNAPLEDEDWHKIDLANSFIRIKKTGVNHEVKIYFDGSKEVVKMNTFDAFVKVEMKQNINQDGSLGLLGTFPTGERVGRDNVLIEDVNAFGQHWQVSPEEPKLFHTYDGEWIVLAGQKCAMPVQSLARRQLRNRRLADGIPVAEAEKVCAHLKSKDDRKACVFDVISTQSLNMASVW